MDVKFELANKIATVLAQQSNGILSTEHLVLAVLQDYNVSKVEREETGDFRDRVCFFIAAKRVEGLSPKTLAHYQIYLEKFAERAPKNIANVTAADIRSFIAYLGEERNLKSSSMQGVINILRSFFNWMAAEDLIQRNPMLRVKSLKVDTNASRRPLSTEELELLRSGCEIAREKAVVELFYSTGCRLAEVLNVRLSDVNFNQRSMRVTGKGNKVRTVYFSIRARLMLQEYLNHRKGESPALFCCERAPFAPLGSRSIQKTLDTVGRRTVITRHIHPHLLRHTFATNLLNSGMDITIIQRLLGHASLDTTRVYAQLSQESVRREYERIVA